MENEKQKTLQFRPLNANEIECRVGSTGANGFYLLLYKNARVDANILDETFGVFNWQKRFYQVKNTMVCEILINANYLHPELEPRWVAKADGGDDDTQMEQVKSELSDSFKRAAFCVGIGRELYYSPKIYIKTTDDNTTKARYSVKQITYKADKRIERLVIVNDKTKEVVFTYGVRENVAQNVENEPNNEEPKGFTPADEDLIAKFQGFNTAKGTIAQADLIYLRAYLNTATDTQRAKLFDYIDKHYQTKSVEDLSELQGKDLVGTFKNGGK